MSIESDLMEVLAQYPDPGAEPPARFQVEDDGTTARISWRWFTGHVVLPWLFCLVFNGFMGYWYSQVLSEQEIPWGAAVVGLLPGGICLALAYWLALRTFNSTYVEVSRDLLTVRHGPLPWRGNLSLPGRSLSQLYVEKVVSDFVNSSHEHIVTYNLMALDREGRKLTVLRRLEAAEEVLYLERLLERRLGIEDRPLAAEVASLARLS